MQETTFGPEEYLASLRLEADGPALVTGIDGAEMYRVADGHYLVFSCAEHVHKGQDLLRRVMPDTWVVFYEAINHDEGFIATHYGPDLDEDPTT